MIEEDKKDSSNKFFAILTQCPNDNEPDNNKPKALDLVIDNLLASSFNDIAIAKITGSLIESSITSFNSKIPPII